MLEVYSRAVIIETLKALFYYHLNLSLLAETKKITS
jgi:hypothetical protein